MVFIKLFIMAFIGALIGWVTNIIAIRLIFRPINPVRIPVVNISVQGLLPRRRGEIARTIGEVIEGELVTYEDILDPIMGDETMESIKSELKKKIREVIEKRFTNIFLRTFKETAATYIENIVDSDGTEMISNFLKKYAQEMPGKINLAKKIEDKINDFEMEYFEKILISIVSKELRHIEMLGAVLGFFIGLVQGLVIVLI
ncbi:MAG: DUF445 domain-containing protein [Acetivibrionales bacterium]|jgi:uncharacterized membrane protein YheB (UPF0754 family)